MTLSNGQCNPSPGPSEGTLIRFVFAGCRGVSNLIGAREGEGAFFSREGGADSSIIGQKFIPIRPFAPAAPRASRPAGLNSRIVELTAGRPQSIIRRIPLFSHSGGKKKFRARRRFKTSALLRQQIVIVNGVYARAQRHIINLI